ncbi:MAG: MBL fold metallo-hydrolase [Spirochaetales bacterium]|jgi:ribonuclease Z
MKQNWLQVSIIVLAGIAALAILLGVLFRKPLSKALFGAVARSTMAKRNVRFDDGLYVGLCGTGSPMPDKNRAGPCIAVLAGKHFYIVDAGSGSTRNIRLMNFPIGKAEAILLTHFHSDHIADLGEMELQRWAGGSNSSPVEVIGPSGVETVVEGFNLAFKLDDGYRVAHHGPRTMPPQGAGGIAKPFELSDAPDASVVVLDADGVKITAFKVDHRPVAPAVGYRFDYKGRSIVISGDTVYSDSLIEHAKGADVLVCEALNASMVEAINENAAATASPSTKKITHDIPSYHSTPEDAAKMANAAGVGQLVLYHIIPPLPSSLVKNLFLSDAKRYYTKKITMSEDGMLVSLPPNSKDVSIRRVF